MSKYSAKVSWSKKSEETFIDGKYSRAHQWSFDGGAIIEASSAPTIVPLPYSIEANVDPEEAFIASLSSCHMLFFLHFAGRKRFAVESYVDQAEGVVEKNSEGKMAMTTVTLHPEVKFVSDNIPTAEEIEQLHHLAHENCFIANSVNCSIEIDPK